MKEHRNLQKEPLPLSHAVNPLHFIKNGEGQVFRAGQMGFVALVALGNVLGCLYDVIFKIVGGLEDLLALRIVVGQAVT